MIPSASTWSCIIVQHDSSTSSISQPAARPLLWQSTADLQLIQRLATAAAATNIPNMCQPTDIMLAHHADVHAS
jgi:hypothetical protein